MTDEQQIRDLIERWAAAVHRGDMATVLADHDPGIVMFDVPPPEQGVRGIDAYRETWPGFFEWQASGAVFEIESLDITAGTDVAFAFALLRGGTPPGVAGRPGEGLRAAHRPRGCAGPAAGGRSPMSTTRSRTRPNDQAGAPRRRGRRGPSSAALRFHLVDHVGADTLRLDRDGPAAAPGPVGGQGQVERRQSVVRGDLGRLAVADAPGEGFEFFGVGVRIA